MNDKLVETGRLLIAPGYTRQTVCDNQGAIVTVYKEGDTVLHKIKLNSANTILDYWTEELV